MTDQARDIGTALRRARPSALAACGGEEATTARATPSRSSPSNEATKPLEGAPPQLAAIREPRQPAARRRHRGVRRPPRRARGHPGRRQQVGVVVRALPAEFPYFQAPGRATAATRSRSSASTPTTPTTPRRRSSASCRSPTRATPTPTRRSTRSSSTPRSASPRPPSTRRTASSHYVKLRAVRQSEDALAADIQRVRPVADNQAGMTGRSDSPGAIGTGSGLPAAFSLVSGRRAARTSATACSVELQRHDQPGDRRMDLERARRRRRRGRAAGDHPPRHAGRARRLDAGDRQATSSRRRCRSSSTSRPTAPARPRRGSSSPRRPTSPRWRRRPTSARRRRSRSPGRTSARTSAARSRTTPWPTSARSPPSTGATPSSPRRWSPTPSTSPRPRRSTPA